MDEHDSRLNEVLKFKEKSRIKFNLEKYGFKKRFIRYQIKVYNQLPK